MVRRVSLNKEKKLNKKEHDHSQSPPVIPSGNRLPFVLLASCFLWWAIANNLAERSFILSKEGQGAQRSPHSGRVLYAAADGGDCSICLRILERLPRGESGYSMITASDQQGNWVPATPLFKVRNNSSHGYHPSAPDALARLPRLSSGCRIGWPSEGSMAAKTEGLFQLRAVAGSEDPPVRAEAFRQRVMLEFAGRLDPARVSRRPDLMMLLYPAISFNEESGGQGIRLNLIGPGNDWKLVEEFSNERQVAARTPSIGNHVI